MIEAGRRLLPVEVKSGQRVRPKDVAGMEAFLEEHPKRGPFGVVVHGGEEVVLLSEKIVGVPQRLVWG